jgi:hypothetical protein
MNNITSDFGLTDFLYHTQLHFIMVNNNIVLFPIINLFQFEEFYNKRFIGRKLTWLHHLSNGKT